MSDETRPIDTAETEAWPTVAALESYGIPTHLHAGLRAYLQRGIRPGSFLLAVLRNDLADAAVRAADNGTLVALAPLGRFLTNEIDPAAWGSASKVELWMLRFKPTPGRRDHAAEDGA